MMSELTTRSILDFYNDPLDQRSPPQEGETSSREVSPLDIRLSLEIGSDLTPYISQRFATHDAAYDYYSDFAKQCGFSIRRHRTEGKDGIGKGLLRRYFVCHRAGNTPRKSVDDAKPHRNRKSSRCGCQAYMRISKMVEAGSSEWRVTGFTNHHNHELLEADQVQFLPAYRMISESDKTRILMYAKTGMSVQQMIKLMEMEKSVEPGRLPFTEKDVRNLIQSFKKLEQDSDNIDLIKVCRNIREKDPNFKYDFTTDADRNVENIAWSYTSTMQSYEIYGDAVVFDTTHRLAALDLPLGIWVGMNNYGMPCLFGCVLLKEETLQSFMWALQVFLRFMNGKAPETILTCQNVNLEQAIVNQMPNTRHAFCIWLIVAKFPCWFSSVLGERYSEWKTDFFRLYNMDNTEDFDIGWQEMVDTYGLHTNRHVNNLFTYRNMWALPYLRDHFFACFTATGISKSINAFIERFLSAQTRIAHFIEQVAVAVDFRDEAGNQQNMQQTVQNVSLKTCAPMEAHAAAVLTPYAFSKLQDELVVAAHYASFHMDGYCFLVRHHTKLEGGRKVTWDPQEELITCSCQMFECSGILCRHAIRVLSTFNYFQIPDHYLPVRWRQNHSLSTKAIQAWPSGESAERVQALQSMVSALITEASKSKVRMDLASKEISTLLSRIKEQPVLVHVSKDDSQ